MSAWAATVLDGAVIEEGGMLGARGLLTPGKRIGRNELWTGAPAAWFRVMSAEERAMWDTTAVHYQENAASARLDWPGCAPRSSSHEAPGGAAACGGAVAACGTLPGPVDTARLPPGEFAVPDPDVAAVNYAAAAFSDQSSTYGNPAAGAEAALAVEFIAGALNSNARWVGIDPDVKAKLLQGRRRAAPRCWASAPNAPSQAVVNALSAARFALQRMTRRRPRPRCAIRCSASRRTRPSRSWATCPTCSR